MAQAHTIPSIKFAAACIKHVSSYYKKEYPDSTVIEDALLSAEAGKKVDAAFVAGVNKAALDAVNSAQYGPAQIAWAASELARLHLWLEGKHLAEVKDNVVVASVHSIARACVLGASNSVFQKTKDMAATNREWDKERAWQANKINQIFLDDAISRNLYKF